MAPRWSCVLLLLVIIVVSRCRGETVLTMSRDNGIGRLPLDRALRSSEGGSGSDLSDADLALRNSTHVHIFSNDSNPSISMIWSGQDGVILALTTQKITGFGSSRLYRSENHGRNFKEISHLIHNDDILADHGLLVSPVNSEKVLLVKSVLSFSSTDVLYISKDSGKSFYRAQLDFNIKEASINFNPLNEMRILAKSKQQHGLWLSYDFGESWKLVSVNVMQAKWDPVDSKLFYLMKDPSMQMIAGGFNHELYKCATVTTLICTRIAENVYSFGVQGGFLFISVEYQELNGSRVMHVSKDCGDTWSAAQIPPIYEKQFYSILDMSEEMVFVHVDSTGGQGDGTIYTSGDKGIIYSESLENHLYPSKGSLTDFYKVTSLPGTYITSQMNIDHGTVHSMITFDKGGAWTKLNAPKGSKCSSSETECTLQIHGLFSQSKGVQFTELPKSTPSAIGIIMVHGNIGDALNYNIPDVYVSNDGGYSWIQPKDLKGPHFYAIGDSGGLLYAVNSIKDTNVILYSTDNGESWQEYAFTESSIKVTGLSVEPGSTSTLLGLWGWDQFGDGAWRAFTLDFKVIMQRCNKDDFVTWHAHLSNNLLSDGACLLGSDVTYTRKRKETTCQKGKTFIPIAVHRPCKCNYSDYFCDYGYKRNPMMRCVLDNSFSENKLDICMHGKDEHIITEGYRKIPGDRCENGFQPTRRISFLKKHCTKVAKEKEDFGVDMIDFTKYETEPSYVEGHPSIALVVFLVIVILALGTGLVYTIRKRNVSAKRVRYVPLATSEHVSYDGLDGSSSVVEVDAHNRKQLAEVRLDSERSTDLQNTSGNCSISYHDDSDEDMLIS